MTDKELLELAFKAYLPDENYTRMVNDAGPDYWNPLSDDGQALRLAVKLNITVHKGFAYTPTGRLFNEVGLTSHLAATRRAIVRAAAEIGKEKSHA